MSSDSVFELRQIFVVTTGCLASISSGFMMAYPSVLNPSTQSPDSIILITSNEASWIAASNGFSGILGFLILSPMFQLVGRKYVNLTVTILLLIGWTIFFFAKNMIHLLSARIIQGIIVGNYYTAAISISEYCDPKRRGYFMSMRKISEAIGTLACHSLAIVINWRLIAGIAAVPVCLSAVMTLFWPESPAFLAMKGRFSECEKSFVWLNGNSQQKRKELNDLINAQSESLERKKNYPDRLILIKLFRQLRTRDFLKSFFIVTFLTLAINGTGRYFLLAYLNQIILDIIGNNAIAMYCAVASDVLLLCALLTSCFIIKAYKRRTILFTFGTFTAVLMFTISLALVLKTHFGIAKDVPWLIPGIILTHSFISHVGVVPIAYAISGEVFPLEHKGLGSVTSGIVFTTFYALSLKLTPLMIESTGVSGTYAIYGLCITLCLILLFIVLPETKDKTLQQIEDEIKGIKRTLESDLLMNANDIEKDRQ